MYKARKNLGKWVLCLSIAAFSLIVNGDLYAGRGEHGGGGGRVGGRDFHGGGERGERFHDDGNFRHNHDYGNYYGPGWGAGGVYYYGVPGVGVNIDNDYDYYNYPQGYDNGDSNTYFYQED